MIKMVFLSENKTDNPDCLAEHGLSIYIETEERKLLFDAGASDIFLRNAEQLNVDLEQVDAVIISHGHYDHTQGVPSFCKVNDKADIYIHKDSFMPTYGFVNGKLDEENCGVRWTIPQFDSMRERLTLTKEITKLTDNIVISGTIPSIAGYSPTEKFYTKDEKGNLVADPMEHEQFLVIKDVDVEGASKGIYIFSGCSHMGVVPCIKYAKKLFPGERIAGFIAGMHLYNSSKEVRKSVLGQVIAEGMDVIIPVHCTGINAICELKIMMGDKCIVAGVGDSFKF